MNNFFHHNTSSNAIDDADLYRIWDDDLKRVNKKRNRWTWVLGISAFIILAGETILLKTSFIGVAFYALMKVITLFIDESNINYLMHSIDVRKMNFKTAFDE